MPTEPKQNSFLPTFPPLLCHYKNIFKIDVKLWWNWSRSRFEAMKMLEKTGKNLPTPPSLDNGNALNNLLIDRFHVIQKGEAIHQITNVSRWNFFNIFMIVEHALLKMFLKGRGLIYRSAPPYMIFNFLETPKSGALWFLCLTQFRCFVSLLQRLLQSVTETVADQ